jgi:hypothetical protein
MAQSFQREIENADWRETEAGLIRRTEGDFFVHDETIAETASAAETITRAVSYTKAIAETASAAETVGGLLLRAGAVAESASAAETVASLRISTSIIAETAAAAETITYSVVGAGGTTYNEAQVEAASAADTVMGERAGVSYDKDIVETLAAIDAVTAEVVPYVPAVWTPEPPPWHAWIEEATAAADWTTNSAPASGTWTLEDAEQGDWQLDTRPYNRWTRLL